MKIQMNNNTSGPLAAQDVSEISLKQENKEDAASVRRAIISIILLAFGWAFTLTTSTAMMTIGPLSSKSLGGSDALSSFTVAVFLGGTACASIPASRIFAKYGRYIGFCVGCSCQIIGSVIGALALYTYRIELIFIGTFFVGLGQGVGQFYRFAAIEISPEDLKSNAVTYVLSGGVLAAFLGPLSANYTISLVKERQFVGSFIVMAIIGIINFIVISFVQFQPKKAPDALATIASLTQRRRLLDILKQPTFLVACAVATLAHTMMVSLMTDATLAMAKIGFPFSTISLVMELHFLSMFGPGFISGKLIASYGDFKVAVIGGFIYITSAIIMVIGDAQWNFFLGMILLGIGWNFSFSAGTVMLTKCYTPAEATKVQASNDFILFGLAGCGIVIFGTVFAEYGWNTVIYCVMCLMGVNMGLFAISYRMQSNARKYSNIFEQSNDLDSIKSLSNQGNYLLYDEREPQAAVNRTISTDSASGRLSRSNSIARATDIDKMSELEQKTIVRTMV